MVSTRVRISGLKEFVALNEKLIKDLEKGIFGEALAKKMKSRAKYVAPRKSGKLVRRIDYKMQGSNFTLTCDAVNEKGEAYPGILEFGSRFIKIGKPDSPRIITSGSNKTAYLPFMRWAVWRTLQEKDKIFKKVMLKNYK